MLLNDKIALITGCSRGIGFATMKRFVEEGALVYANSSNADALDASIKEIDSGLIDRIYPVSFDICDTQSIKQCILRIKKEQGRLDILVNNAGILHDALIGMVDDSTLHSTFETNVFATIHMVQMSLKLMQRQKSGSIINLSSIVGLRGNEGETVYAASKGAVANLTMTWARELASCGIRVNAIAPGKIDTQLYRSIGEEKAVAGIEDIKMGRLGTPEEVANVAVFLASELSSYITGEIISVHGGWFL